MAKAEIEQLKTQIKTKEDKAMKEMVTIKLPRIAGEKNQEVFVGVNGIPYKIQRGKEVEVPKALAEILENSSRMEDIAQEYIEKNQTNN